MIKVSIQVRSGAARVKVSVVAESVERALNLVAARFPESNVGVLAPRRAAGGPVPMPETLIA